MKVSFIIVSWNVCDLLERCVRSITQLSHELPHEIIVVDNASSDTSAAMVAEKFPQVKLIVNNENQGFAAACNQGIEESVGEYVFFLNPDSEIHEGTLQELVDYLDAHPRVGIVVPQTRNEDGNIQRSIRRDPTPLSQLAILLKLGKLFPRTTSWYRAEDFDYTRDEQDIEQPAGSALLVRRSALEQIGMFDEQFFLWFDEVDLCKRMRNGGWTIVYCANAFVIHHSGKSFAQKGLLEKQRIFFTSCARYLKKHWGVSGWTAAMIMHSVVAAFALLDSKLTILKSSSIFTGSENFAFPHISRKLFFRSLGVIICIELLSLAAYFYGPIGAVTAGIISGVAFLATFRRLEYGIAILFAELIIGSKGYLFFISIGNYSLSIRMMLFGAVIAGWLLHLLKKRQGSAFFSSPLRWWSGVLGLAILWGIVSGLINSNATSLVVADANAWLFFLILPVLTDALQKKEHVLFFLIVLGAALTSSLIKVLLVFYMMGHRGFGDEILTVVYRWIRSTGVGELTQLDSLYRIFFQSQIFVVILFFILVSFVAGVAHAPIRDAVRRHAALLIFFIGSIASLILSFSRSFWLGILLMLAVFCMGLLFSIRKNVKAVSHFFILGAGSLICTLFLLFLISAIPVPSRDGVFSVDLLSDRVEDLEDEAAAASRWNLLPIMLTEIVKNPVGGYGFGKTLTYTSKDPRVLLEGKSGLYTTYAFEWGYLDLWLKLGLFGLLGYLLFIARVFVLGADTFRRLSERGTWTEALFVRGLLYGLGALCIIHFFTPYLNHPLGIGIVMLAAVLFERMKRIA